MDNLDPVIGERFVGRNEKMAVLAFPTEPIWNPDFLDRFVTEVRGAAESVLDSNEEVPATSDRICSRLSSDGPLHPPRIQSTQRGEPASLSRSCS